MRKDGLYGHSDHSWPLLGLRLHLVICKLPRSAVEHRREAIPLAHIFKREHGEVLPILAAIPDGLLQFELVKGLLVDAVFGGDLVFVEQLYLVRERLRADCFDDLLAVILQVLDSSISADLVVRAYPVQASLSCILRRLAQFESHERLFILLATATVLIPLDHLRLHDFENGQAHRDLVDRRALHRQLGVQHVYADVVEVTLSNAHRAADVRPVSAGGDGCVRLLGSCLEQARLQHTRQRDWHFVEEVIRLCFDRGGIATSIELHRVLHLGSLRLPILIIHDQVRRLIRSQWPSMARRTDHTDVGSWLLRSLLRQA